MLRIQQYDAGNLALQPTERGVDARLQEARRTQGFYNEAAELISGGARARSQAQGDIDRSVAHGAEAVSVFAKQQEDYAGHRAISKASAGGAQLISDLTGKWDDITKGVKGPDGNWITPPADPNDPAVAAKFREDVLEPALQAHKEAYSGTDLGQRFSEQQVESMRSHFFQKTAADMSSLAAHAVATNVRELQNSASNTAIRSPDYHTVDFLRDKARTDIAAIIGSSPNLKGAAAGKALNELTQQTEEQIVRAAAVGAIAKSGDPEGTAQSFIARYPTLINGAEAKMLASNARQQLRAARVDESYARHNADLERKNVSEAAENEILKKVYSDDPKVAGQVTTRSVVNDDRLSNPTKEKMIRLVDREMKPESDARISAINSRDLFRRIHLPDGDPNKITDLGPINQERIDGGITKADHKDLREEVTQARTPEGEKLGKEREEFFKRYAASIDGAMDYGGHSAKGSQQMYLFTQDVRRQETALRKAGQDPHSLYDPRSPNFIGKPENIAKYHVSMSDAMKFEREMSGIPNINLTGPGKDVTGAQVIDIPRGMSAREVIKNYKSGTKIRLPDGRTGTVP